MELVQLSSGSKYMYEYGDSRGEAFVVRWAAGSSSDFCAYPKLHTFFLLSPASKSRSNQSPMIILATMASARIPDPAHPPRA